MDPVIFVQLVIPQVVPLDGFAGQTQLLSVAHKFRSHVVLMFCDPKMTKDPSVSGVFNEVVAQNGEWTLEIAVEVPDLLPSLEDKSEAIVTVMGADGTKKQMCLSNRMSRFHFQDGENAYHALMPRNEAWHGAVQVGGENGQLLIAAEEQLRTVAAMRFQVTGNDTEHAFESSIRRCVDTLLLGVNTVLHATRECKSGIAPTTRSLRWDAVPSVYALMSGEGTPRGALLALNGARIALNPEKFNDDQVMRFRAIASGAETIGDVDRLMGEARSSWESGDFEFAFLQSVIAAEIETMRTIRAACVRRGVSNAKLKDLRKEMTYSLALNVHLPLCLSGTENPPRALVEAMNKARSKRNDLMHEASFDMTREEVGQLITDTREFVNALRQALSEGAAAVSHATIIEK